MTKEEYQFAILRFIPDVVRGEFINVGVAFMGRDFFRFAYVPLDPLDYPQKWQVHQAEYGSYVSNLCTALESAPKEVGAYLRLSNFLNSILPPDDSSFQFGSIMYGISDNLTAEFERTIKRFL